MFLGARSGSDIGDSRDGRDTFLGEPSCVEILMIHNLWGKT
jgi:hypothetical protein